MKILIVTDAWHPQVNGVVRTYEHICAELIKKGYKIKIIGPGQFPIRFPAPGYLEIELACLPYKRLQKMIDAYKPDYIHIAVEGPLGWAARRYCLNRNLPFTTSYHTQFPDYIAARVAKIFPFLAPRLHNIAARLIRRFHRPALSIMVSTETIAKRLKSWNFEPSIHQVTRGVDTTIFNPGPKTLFKNFKKPVALYVGRVAIEKNIEDFLEMPWDGSKVVVGQGPSFSRLKAQYPEVVFTGIQTGEALAAHYRSADVFVFPSRTDTFGIVIIEALACGLPVAAYEVPGPRDILVKPELGALGTGNLAITAEKALNAGKPDERADHVKKYYSWARAAEQFENAMMNSLTDAGARRC